MIYDSVRIKSELRSIMMEFEFRPLISVKMEFDFGR